MPNGTRILVAVVATVALTSGAARAETVVGAELDVGGATITAPRDGAGEPTLLYGTSFTGPSVRFAGTVETTLVGPLSLGARIGLSHASMSGHAERDGLRRELDLRFTALDVLVNLRVGAQAGPVRPYGAIGIGGRFGVHAAAVETRVGFTASDDAPSVATSNSGLLSAEGGFVVATGQCRIPVALTATRSLTYGTTTRDRLDGYANLAVPGAFRVDANWTYGIRLGFGWAF